MEQESSTKGADGRAGTGDDGQAVKLGERERKLTERVLGGGSWGRRAVTELERIVLGRAHKGSGQQAVRLKHGWFVPLWGMQGRSRVESVGRG